MTSPRFRKRFEALMALADIRIDGGSPWDIQVHEEEFFSRIFAYGSLGMGESYMDGCWDCEDLAEMTSRVCRADLKSHIRPLRDAAYAAHARLLNLKDGKRGADEGKRHYELGRDLYRRMLDQRMIYSCAYWKDAETLDLAQEHKLDLIARKLQLKPGMKVLDIGCGWGGAINYFAEKYGITGVAVTISRDQQEAGKELCAGLPVEIRLQDYREVDETFDCSYSIDMLAHVGRRNYRAYMQKVRRCLKDGGLHLVQTAGSESSTLKADPWVNRYIFPDSHLPSAKQLMAGAEGVLRMEDWQSLTLDYDRTFTAWYDNFAAAWEDLSDDYDERFFRMWRYYLLTFAGAFRSRASELWQILFSAGGANTEYIR